MTRKNAILPVTELALIAAMAEIGKDYLTNTEEAGSDSDPIEAFGESHMENLSAATYTELRLAGRLSYKAFAHILRVKKDDLVRMKESISFEPNEYHDVALSVAFIQILSMNAELAAGLRLVNPGKNVKSSGPYTPQARSFDLTKALPVTAAAWAGDRFANQPNVDVVAAYIGNVVANTNGKHQLSETEQSAIKLAGLFKLRGVHEIAAMVAAGGTEPAIQLALSIIVLDSLKASARFAEALEGAQPN